MKMELFNEFMLLLSSQTLFVFTDYLSAGFDPYAKYIFGWYLSGLMIFTVVTNTVLSLIDTLKSLISQIRRRFCKKSAENTIGIKPNETIESLEVPPPPRIVSPRDRVLQFKSSQDVIGKWINDVGAK